MKLINYYRTSGGLTFLALVVILAGQFAEAEYVVYESATMGPPGQIEGYLLSTDQYMGTRFYVDRQYEVTQIGGHLAQANVGGNFFGAIVALTGVTSMDARFGGLTVRVAWPDTPSFVALMAALPSASPLARPDELTVATSVLVLDQAT